MDVSEQFRAFTGIGDPDPSLGLENAKGVEGGEPVDTGDTLGLDEVEADHIDGDVVDEPDGGTPADEVDYADLSVDDLVAEVNRRNEGRDEADRIVVEDGDRDSLVTALELDDLEAEEAGE